MRLIPKEIEEHYLQSKESERLSNEWGELERLRTQAILARHLPSTPAVIFDVGGGTGAYAVPRAKQGYRVHLIDPVAVICSRIRRRVGIDHARGRPQIGFPGRQRRCGPSVGTLVSFG